MSISAYLKKNGHKTELVMNSDPERALKDVLSMSPQVLCFSSLIETGDFEWGVYIARKVKNANPDVLIVFGGLYPTLFPDDVMKNTHIDIICRGEGELPLLELCDNLDKKKDISSIPGLWVRSNSITAKNDPSPVINYLDDIPFPDRSLYDKYKYFDSLNSIDILTSRGCPFDCSYCYNSITKHLLDRRSNPVRLHSVDYVIQELEKLKNRYHPRSFTFVDELFPIKPEWISEFSEKYRLRVGLPFICNVRPDTLTKDSMFMLKKAGLRCVCMGLETGNENLRRDLLNKNLTNLQFEKAAELLHQSGIKFLTANILGLPGERLENAFETIEFNRKLKTDYVYFSVFQPYPGLPITKCLVEEGSIKTISPDNFDSTYFKGSPLEQPDIRDIVNLHKLFLITFRFPILKSFVKHLIKLPPNPVFNIIFMLSFAHLQLKCFQRNPWQLLKMGLGNFRIFSGKR